MYCPKCKRDDLTELDFGRNASRKNGLQAYCRECSNRYQQEWVRGDHSKTVHWNSALERDNAYSRKWDKAHPDKARESLRVYYARKRQAYVAPVSEEAIYARDGWICQLCGEPVDPTLKFPHWMSASLDHIIPLSKGGTHEPANVQLAHWICNTRKQHKT